MTCGVLDAGKCLLQMPPQTTAHTCSLVGSQTGAIRREHGDCQQPGSGSLHLHARREGAVLVLQRGVAPQRRHCVQTRAVQLLKVGFK